jgi:hypothetical protein
MKKKALFLVMACAMILSAQPVFAVATCADWLGDWTFNYGSKCDNVTMTEVCNNEDGSNPACLPVKDGKAQEYWICIARGKRQSDNQTIQIRRISFAKTVYAYYEKTNEELFATGGDTPADYIPVDLFTGTAFTVDNSNPPFGSPAPANTGIACGAKGKVACVACGDNGTDNCTLTTVPKKIIKLLSFANPFSGIIIIGDDKTAFTAQDKPDWDTTAIFNLLSLKISGKIIIDIVFINPLSKDTGVKNFTVGSYCGTIEIK